MRDHVIIGHQGRIEAPLRWGGLLGLRTAVLLARSLCLIPLTAGLAAAGPNSVVGDKAMRQAEIRIVEQSMDRIADRGAALFFLSLRHAQVGDSGKALSLLRDCLALDEGFDPSEVPQLDSLRNNPQFQALARHAEWKYPPVHKARIAFSIPQPDLFPEGMAADTARRVFYAGSVREKVLRLDEQGKVTALAKVTSRRTPSMNGLRVDPRDHTLWVAAGDEDGSELLHLHEDGTLLESFQPSGPPPHELNDLVLLGREVYVTDSLAHRVYRFDRQRHVFEPLTLERPLLYPNGIAVSDDGTALYIADILGVLRFDVKNRTARDVEPGGQTTLAGIDGLYWYQGSLVGVQYGNGRSRVARWHLSDDGRKVLSTEVLEYRSPLVKFPTTGAILDGRFYFFANTGLDNFQNGRVLDPRRLEPVHVAVVELSPH